MNQSCQIKISIVASNENGGKLGLCQCPGKKLTKGRDGKEHIRDLHSDLLNFKERGVRTIVCLLNDSELRSLGVQPQQYKILTKNLDIEFIQYPILEMAPPDNIESLENQVLIPIANIFTQNGFIVIHCRGGIGRAGTVAGCFLKKLRFFSNFSAAVQHLRKKRDKRCIESRKQEDFVKTYFSLMP
ncbi:hypothetical protein SteCoe_15374 [Stentor coeruleus]|uniref:Tyrosine specific protein phosphatases domain-containing protein n=1 Tax=Stentor coeruleus TaxID=5963 RepID=A0A1R2C3S6_9CILI|nr:hypothetical protein SteCoe_15374 [Stentor coeruleus]